jgi:hypothetical protein
MKRHFPESGIFRHSEAHLELHAIPGWMQTEITDIVGRAEVCDGRRKGALMADALLLALVMTRRFVDGTVVFLWRAKNGSTKMFRSRRAG